MLNTQNLVVRSGPLLAAALAAVLAPQLTMAQNAGDAGNAAPPPVAYASVSELNGILAQLQQTTQSMQTNLESMRVEKWKTDASSKQQTLANIESIRRNLKSARPETVTQLNGAPENLEASFKLYRNLDALYDVFGSIVESAGAFGSKAEYQTLGNDMTSLESVRRSFAERMQKLAAGKDDELARLRTQVKALTAAPPPPPKKVVVDDTEPPKKPVKKKVAKPKPPATTDAPASTPPSQ
jgi:DNA anti-recombination protein RmuC